MSEEFPKACRVQIQQVLNYEEADDRHGHVRTVKLRLLGGDDGGGACRRKEMSAPCVSIVTACTPVCEKEG